MTAYSIKNQEFNGDNNKTNISWELRTVNHRYLDISLSIPNLLLKIENQLKERIREKIGRGKLDAKLTLTTSGSEVNEIPINKEKVEALLSARHMLESISKKPVPLSGMDILNWPGVLEESQEEDADTYLSYVESLLDTAMDELIVTRENEGKRLLTLIHTRCETIVDLVEKVRLRRVEVMSSLRDKVLNKLANIDVTADPNRLEQEMVFQAQRLDVDEELDRIDSHINEIKDVLTRNEPVGRRLDFLMQELHREANTLASKSNDAETTRCSVDLKVLIEQMREQVMNIE